MLTIKHLSGSSVSLSDGKTDVIAFPKKPVANAVNLLSSPEESPKLPNISWPGEYDVGGVAIRGIGHKEGQQVSYVLQMDDVRVALASSPVDEWSQADIERLGDVHVLVLPAENVKHAQTLIDEVDPRVLVLVSGADGTMDPDVVKAAGATGKEPVSEYKLKGSLPAEGRETVVLSA
jgi:hypothetical protein